MAKFTTYHPCRPHLPQARWHIPPFLHLTPTMHPYHLSPALQTRPRVHCKVETIRMIGRRHLAKKPTQVLTTPLLRPTSPPRLKRQLPHSQNRHLLTQTTAKLPLSHPSPHPWILPACHPSQHPRPLIPLLLMRWALLGDTMATSFTRDRQVELGKGINSSACHKTPKIRIRPPDPKK